MNRRRLNRRTTKLTLSGVLLLLLCAAGCADAKGIEPVPKLDLLQVLPATGALEIGETASVGALRLQGATSMNVTGTVEWSSDDESVVTVSYDPERGAVVEAVGLGMATITATDDDASGTAEFVVRPSIVGIELDKRTFELAKGSSLPLGAAMFDSRGGKASYDETGTWGSSAPAVATVDDTGVVLGVETGESVITLTRDGITASQRVFVRDWTLESIEAAAVAGRTLPFGQSSPIRVTGRFSGGRTQDITSLFSLELESPVEDDPEAEPILTLEDATVTAGATEGMGSVRGEGASGSLAADQEFSIEFTVVDAPLTALSLDLPRVVAVGGDSAVASIVGSYGEDLEFETAATLSAEPAERVAIDNAAATITGLEPGSVEITAMVVLEDGDGDPATGEMISASGTLEVVDASVSVLTISLASAEDRAAIATGETTTLTAAASFGTSEAIDVTNLAVWSSSDEAVARVSNVAAGTVTAWAAGMATITATYRGTSAEFVVTVGAP